ncbi:MAG: low molecular weight protein arginine phosphatase [Opitutales bacterium]|nr:low molecular weight protein arginine phosphatase [Opitutales bacterium]
MIDEPLVICVCTANICRSPMAEKLLEHALKAEDAPLSNIKVISAGVSAWDGEAASPNSVKALKKVGIDLSKHRSRELTRDLMDKATLVVAMTQAHLQMIRQFFPNSRAQLMLVRELLPPPADPEIGDPWGSDLESYEACRDSIVEAIPSIVTHLKLLLSAE